LERLRRMLPRRVSFDPANRVRVTNLSRAEVTNLSRAEVTNLSRSQVTNLSGSDKTCLIPQGYTGPQACESSASELGSFLVRAVAADKTKNRTEITPPSRSGREAHARRKGKHPLTTYSRLKSCLRAVAVRALSDLTVDGHQAPDAEELAEALETLAWEHYGHVIHLREPGEPADALRGWTFTDADGVTDAARQAAGKALGTLSWSPEGREELRRRQAVGGSRGHRGPSKVTPENVARLEALPVGLTVAEQAKHLRLNKSTVKRLRRFLK